MKNSKYINIMVHTQLGKTCFKFCHQAFDSFLFNCIESRYSCTFRGILYVKSRAQSLVREVYCERRAMNIKEVTQTFKKC